MHPVHIDLMHIDSSQQIFSAKLKAGMVKFSAQTTYPSDFVTKDTSGMELHHHTKYTTVAWKVINETKRHIYNMETSYENAKIKRKQTSQRSLLSTYGSAVKNPRQTPRSNSTLLDHADIYHGIHAMGFLSTPSSLVQHCIDLITIFHFQLKQCHRSRKGTSVQGTIQRRNTISSGWS